jgi:transcription elongation GreA/GreB family factor
VSKAFVKQDGSEVEPEPEALPSRPSQPLPVTPAGHARLLAEYERETPGSRRARVLARVLETVRIEQPGRLKGGVGFGCEVTVEDDAGGRSTYRIVGPDEVEQEPGRLSVLSPVARALLGKCEGDDVIIRRPKGELEVTVVSIRV